jgi:hypothetical protein
MTIGGGAPEQHQQLEALAATQGKSIQEFVLASTLGTEPPGKIDALAELTELLEKRLAAARAGNVSARTVRDILEQVKRETAGLAPNG